MSSDGMIKLICDFCEVAFGYILYKPLDRSISLRGAQAACPDCMNKIVENEGAES